MQQAKEYQSRAELAERQAAKARDDTERRAFLEIARLWRSLAKDRLRILADQSDESD